MLLYRAGMQGIVRMGNSNVLHSAIAKGICPLVVLQMVPFSEALVCTYEDRQPLPSE